MSGNADFLGETAADPLDVDNPPAAPDNRGRARRSMIQGC